MRWLAVVLVMTLGCQPEERSARPKDQSKIPEMPTYAPQASRSIPLMGSP